MGGSWNPTAYREISHYTGELLDYAEDMDGGGDTGSSTWFEGWASQTITNTGEGGNVTVAKSGSSTFDIYESDSFPGVFQFKDSGYFEANGNDISGYTYVDEITFNYDIELKYSNDYLHADFKADAVALWDLFKATYDFEAPDWGDPLLVVNWNADKTGFFAGVPTGGGGGGFMQLPNGISTFDPLAAGVQWEEYSTVGPADAQMTIFAATVRYRGALVVYNGVYTHNDDPPDIDVTVDARTSTLQPYGSFTFVIEPTTGEISALTGSNTASVYTVGWKEEYTEPTPDFPVPS
jgi:hypothetical protein